MFRANHPEQSRRFFFTNQEMFQMLIPTIYPKDELLSLPQLAKALEVAPMTARVWVLSGKIPAREVGAGRIVVRRVDVDAFLAAR